MCAQTAYALALGCYAAACPHASKLLFYALSHTHRGMQLGVDGMQCLL